jgi:[acyl-carrier-protein] S-malonyltransferase
MTVAVLFPGQGSQHVGMGADLFELRPDLLGDRADDILGWSLRRLCLDGTDEALTRTQYAQAALFAISYALWEELRAAFEGRVAGGAGHSLGEYTALAAAGALVYEQALAVVARRGEAMADAAGLEPSGMAALIGADVSLAEDVASRRRAGGGRLQVANSNAPGQVVVAGGDDDIEWVSENGRELGVRRVIRLNVAGAFHSSFMEPAADEVGKALAEITFDEPAFPVWSNTTARPHSVASLPATLRSQVVSTVRFEESLQDMAANGIDTFVHVGPGDVTAGMAKRTVGDAAVHVVSQVSDIPDVVASLVTVS